MFHKCVLHASTAFGNLKRSCHCSTSAYAANNSAQFHNYNNTIGLLKVLFAILYNKACECLHIVNLQLIGAQDQVMNEI